MTHNGDESVPAAAGAAGLRLLEDARLLHWFAQNPSLLHPKLSGLPIGLTNRRNAGREGNADLQAMEKYLRYCTYPGDRCRWASVVLQGL